MAAGKENVEFGNVRGKKKVALFRRFVVLDTDLVGDTGMAVSEIIAFPVADDLA
jgi:hypothetical protein